MIRPKKNKQMTIAVDDDDDDDDHGHDDHHLCVFIPPGLLLHLWNRKHKPPLSRRTGQMPLAALSSRHHPEAPMDGE